MQKAVGLMFPYEADELVHEAIVLLPSDTLLLVSLREVSLSPLICHRAKTYEIQLILEQIVIIGSHVEGYRERASGTGTQHRPQRGTKGYALTLYQLQGCR
jgi:hypothetical protein